MMALATAASSLEEAAIAVVPGHLGAPQTAMETAVAASAPAGAEAIAGAATGTGSLVRTVVPFAVALPAPAALSVAGDCLVTRLALVGAVAPLHPLARVVAQPCHA